jgi:hypothetical protein
VVGVCWTVVAAILIPSIIVAAAGCDSTPDLGTATAAPATDAPTLLPPPTDTPVPTVDPNASTGGSVFPDARVIITSCVNHPSQATMDPVTGGVGTVFTLTGTITNTGTTTNDYVAIAILATAGRFNFGSADSFAVSLLPPGQTRSWKTQGLVTNNPTQPLTCSVASVLSQPG